MNKHWMQWSARWEVLSQRERNLLLLTAVVLPVVLIYVLLIEKPLLALEKLPKNIAGVERELGHQTRLLTMLQQQEVKDPNIAAREELKRLRKQLAAENEKVKQAAQNLVSPQKMLTVLRSVLANEQGAEMQAVRSLPVEIVKLGSTNTQQNSENDKTTADSSAVIYLHPFEVELKGNYQGIYSYLRKLESLEAVFFWDVLEYNVDEHPSAAVKIKVHTLSYEAGWLGA